MWIKEITILNYKSIREMNIKFQSGVNLLIGDNGVGKTSVLEAITVAFGDFMNGISGVSKIKSTFDTEEGIKQGEVTRRDETAKSKTRFIGKEVSDYANRKVNDLSEELPLFCYYSTSRLAPPKREDFGTASKNKLNDRTLQKV